MTWALSIAWSLVPEAYRAGILLPVAIEPDLAAPWRRLSEGERRLYEPREPLTEEEIAR